MKRKIFSKLLMGAFLIASVSSFVSCKDYDDDINNLQKQIDAAALKADLNALQQTLAAQIAAAQSAAEKAQAAAVAAQNTANAAATKEALDAVKTIATNAGTAAAQGIADAANAKAAADAAQTTANNAGTAAEKAAADAAKAIADAAAAQNTANVAATAAAAAQKAAEVAQSAADGANTNATKALADAATAIANAASAQEAAKAAQGTADAATAAAAAGNDAASKAQVTAETAIAAAANAATQAAEALAAAQAAQVAAAEAGNSNEAIRGLLEKANKYADDAAAAALKAAEAALAASEGADAATKEAAAATEAAAQAKKAVEEATKSIADATDAKIAAAVAEVVANQKDLDEAQSADFAAQLKVVSDAQENLATAEALSDAVKGIQEGLEAAVEEAKVEAAKAAYATFQAAVDELYAGVTSVELVASFSGSSEQDLVTFPLGFATTTGVQGINLNFIFGKQQWTAKFGDKETESGWSEGADRKGQDMEGFDADKIIPYTAGDDIRAKRALLVRVNPTNATFSKEDVVFINSQLETLDGLVEVYDEPYRYDGLITRGQESGLWVIPVKVVDGTSFNKFNETVFYKGKDKAWDLKTDYVKNADDEYELNIGKAGLKQKLYAIAINNTTDAEDAETPRYVTSTFDIATAYKHFTPERYIQARFEWTKVDKTPGSAWITEVHNRWWSTVGNGEPADAAGIWSFDQEEAYTLLNPEKRWNPKYGTAYPDYYATSKIFTPTCAENANGYTHPFKAKFGSDERWNTTNASGRPSVVGVDGDMRRDLDMIDLSNYGDAIKITLPTTLQEKFEYWYITYDFQYNAVESSPSEWEAWKSYKDGITGIYEMTAATQPINLCINKETAYNDVIGFRIWAVNYDGSLADPDGRAFYVKVGDPTKANTKVAAASFKAVSIDNDLTKIDNLNAANYTAEKGFNVSSVVDLEDYKFESLTLSKNSGATKVARLVKVKPGDPDNTNALADDVTVYWKLLDGKGALAKNWKDIKKLVLGVDGAELQEIVTGVPFDVITISDKRTDANKQEVYSLTIKATKVLPDDEWVKKNYYTGKFTWHSDYDPIENAMTIYPKPYKVNGTTMVLKPADLGTAPAHDFYWRDNGSHLLWDGYMDGTYLDWKTTAANAGVRMIQDYNYKPKDDAEPTVDLSLYFFNFYNMPSATDMGNQTYTTYWKAAAATQKLGNNTMVAVLPEVIRTDKQASLHYNFIGVDTKLENGNYNSYDYTPAVWSFTAKFKDALDLVSLYGNYPIMGYTEWQMNSLGVRSIKGTQYVRDSKYYVAWEGGTGATDFSHKDASTTTSYKFELYKLGYTDYTYTATGKNPETGNPWALDGTDADKQASWAFNAGLYEKDYTFYTNNTDDLTGLLRVAISESDDVLATGTLNSGIWSGAGLNYATPATVPFDPAYYSFDNPATKAVESAMTFELTGEIATYLKIDPTSSLDAMKVFKVGGVAEPKVNIPGYLKLTGYDVFGKKHEFTIPVELVYNF